MEQQLQEAHKQIKEKEAEKVAEKEKSEAQAKESDQELAKQNSKVKQLETMLSDLRLDQGND